MQNFVASTIRADVRRKDAPVAFFGLDDERTGGIAKQNCRITVFPGEEAANRFSTDKQNSFELSG